MLFEIDEMSSERDLLIEFLWTTRSARRLSCLLTASKFDTKLWAGRDPGKFAMPPLFAIMISGWERSFNLLVKMQNSFWNQGNVQWERYLVLLSLASCTDVGSILYLDGWFQCCGPKL